MKNKRIYHFFFPENEKLTCRKLRWTIMVILQELQMCKFKAVLKYFVKKSYRKDINVIRDMLSKGALKGTKGVLPLNQIIPSHEINYPEWVVKLEANYVLHNLPFKRIKVIQHNDQFLVIDGNHRLQAMQNCLESNAVVEVLFLTYK